ncbi:hypothetical protein F5Y06DRAFT_270389 [Hypoxylon sp. FL0890]|nr:hypothetical protein F5Y06DRAFT_270389 [Hypoxylon sp. FL0890]
MSESCLSYHGRGRLALAPSSLSDAEGSPSRPASPLRGLSPTESSTEDFVFMSRRKRLILTEEEEVMMIERARSTTASLIRDSTALVPDLIRLNNMIRDLQDRMTMLTANSKDMLPPSLYASIFPDIHLEHLKALLGRAEDLSTGLPAAAKQLQSFLGTRESWDELFGQLDRLCLPPAFWSIRAKQLLRRVTVPDLPGFLFDTFDEHLGLEERHAEHFCRLSPKGRYDFLLHWKSHPTGRDRLPHYKYLQWMFGKKKFQDIPGYDTRPIPLWAAEAFTFYRRWESDGESEFEAGDTNPPIVGKESLDNIEESSTLAHIKTSSIGTEEALPSERIAVCPITAEE